MPAKCYFETILTLPVVYGENESNVCIYHGTGTTMDMYEYTAGTMPQNTNEIAITRLTANKIKADIGDTVTMKTIDGDKEYIITAFFQSMNQQGDGIRLHSDEEINYVQSIGSGAAQIIFTDNPNKEEILNRIEKIKELYPEAEDVEISEDFIADMLGVTDFFTAIE